MLGSHDGLAQKQVRDILPPEELERLQGALVGERQGLCNYAKVNDLLPRIYPDLLFLAFLDFLAFSFSRNSSPF